MEYINLTTKERLPLYDLCIRVNASIPSGHEYEQVSNLGTEEEPEIYSETWAPIRDILPEVPAGHHLALNGVVVQGDGRYAYQYDVVEDPAVVEAVPVSISAFQAQAIMMEYGIYDTVNSYMQQPDTPPMHKLAWEKAQEFKRQSPTVALVAKLLDLSDETLDAMFIAGSKIEA